MIYDYKLYVKKTSHDIPGQLNLFNEAEMEQDPQTAEAEELAATLPVQASKNRATDAERFKGIPFTKKYLDLADEDKLCPVCNTPLVKIGEEFVRRELVFVPAKLKVVEIYSLNYGCPECSKQDVPVIKRIRGNPSHALWHGICRYDCMGHVSEVLNSLPYCRQEKD